MARRIALFVGGLCLCAFVCAALTPRRAHAYDVRGGDVLVRPLVGMSQHLLHLDVATRATPAAGMLLGLDAEWALDPVFSVAGGVRPFVGSHFVDVGTWLGGKARYTELRAPLLPWIGGGAMVAIGGPLGYGATHAQIGARAALGVDYFIIRDFALGLEVGSEVSWLWTPLATLEWSTDVLVSAAWRL